MANDFKAQVLLSAYLKGIPINKEHQELLKEILVLAPRIIDIWISLSLQMHELFRRNRCPKNMTLKSVRNIIEFSQRVMQGVWAFKEPIYQLPCVNEQTLKSLKRKLKRTPQLDEIVEMTDEQRRELDVWAATEVEQVNQVCKVIPRYTFSVEVENADDIAVGDIININIKVVRENLKEGEEAGFIHSNAYPYLRKDNILGLVTDLKEEKYFVSYFKITGQKREESTTMRMRAPFQSQKMALAFHLFSDCYMDKYHREEVFINVLKREEIKEQLRPDQYYHPDDLKLPKTMYQMALDYAKEDNSDEDIEDEDGNVIKENDNESSEEESDTE